MSDCSTRHMQLWGPGRLFHQTQGHWGVKPNPEPWIEGLSECGVECVQVGQCVRGDCVEGQSAGRPVQIHSYSAGARGEGRYGSALIVVPGRVSVTNTLQTPGHVIVSEPTVFTFSFSDDPFIRSSYRDSSSTALCLPVTATRQTLFTQHLWPVDKSLWVIRIQLLLSPPCHLSVLLRQKEESVCCVWVQCELTGIWWGRPRPRVIIIVHIRISLFLSPTFHSLVPSLFLPVSLTRLLSLWFIAQWLVHLTGYQEVGGSNPPCARLFILLKEDIHNLCVQTIISLQTS